MFGLPEPFDVIVRAGVLALAGVCWIALLVRISGLRTLSKMTAIDFVVTLATGSLLATMVSSTNWAGFAQALLGAAAITGWQWVYARGRRATEVQAVAENQPRLLMRNGRFLDGAMADARVTREDIRSKLREANVHHLAGVEAVVLEVTGDISVLHGGRVDAALLEGVRDA